MREAAKLVAASADIALIIDSKGIIRDMAFSSPELAREHADHWLGKRWIETVTIESRPKIESLLADAAQGAMPRWRQVNHPSRKGPDLPVLYAAIPVGDKDAIVAVGRDLSTLASLQQKLIDAQQSMEREYARLRNAETRYRLLFQLASEAVLIVDATTRRIVEANPAANRVIGADQRQLVGRPFADFFHESSSDALQSVFAAARKGDRLEDVPLRSRAGDREFLVTASLFRQGSNSYFLMRLSPVHMNGNSLPVPSSKSKVVKVVEDLPDGFVVTDTELNILTANAAFLDLAQLASEEQAVGQSLGRWVGRPGVDVNALVSGVREHGSVRNFSTIVRGEYGATEDVELSGVSVLSGDQSCFGFTLRPAAQKMYQADTPGTRALPRSVEQLTHLVGRVSLKELVREATDVIERLCIEAALELTNDNRASAAEMLGLSRQSLYSKLRRYGLGDLDANDANEADAAS
ncbi:MAG: transcriptional regulator PpsR [Hyphomicrobiales bacterium]